MAQIYFANLNDSFIKWNDKSAKLTGKTYTKCYYVMRNCNLCSLISDGCREHYITLDGATWNPFCPVFRTLGDKGSQKGSLHVQEPKKVPYNYNQKWF